MDSIPLHEAIRLFPRLVNEPVMFGSMTGSNIQTATEATFQFVGDNNYRTARLSSVNQQLIEEFAYIKDIKGDNVRSATLVALASAISAVEKFMPVSRAIIFAAIGTTTDEVKAAFL